MIFHALIDSSFHALIDDAQPTRRARKHRGSADRFATVHPKRFGLPEYGIDVPEGRRPRNEEIHEKRLAIMMPHGIPVVGEPVKIITGMKRQTRRLEKKRIAAWNGDYEYHRWGEDSPVEGDDVCLRISHYIVLERRGKEDTDLRLMYAETGRKRTLSGAGRQWHAAIHWDGNSPPAWKFGIWGECRSGRYAALGTVAIAREYPSVEGTLFAAQSLSHVGY